MQAGNAQRQVAILGLFKTGGADHPEKGVLIREAADRFDQITVRILVLRDRLARPQQEGATRVLMHSVVWQYIPQEEREGIVEMMEQAGQEASKDKPLAWISLEANRDTHRHELTVRYWPGGQAWQKLATAHPHGSWIEWEG